MTSILSAVSGFDPAFSPSLVARQVASDRTDSATQDAALAEPVTQTSPALAKPPAAHSVGTQFEAMFLRQVLEDMLPKNATSVFGSGTAGGIWRSMLADHLANTLAERNTLGLASTIAAEAGKPEKSISE